MTLIGTRLGPYEIIEEIGQGGMATVFRAYQPAIGRFVALKVIHRAIAADANALERFQREARLIARLEHPHLLPVYDYDGENDPPYIVMRYLEGSTLKDALEHEPIPLADAVHIVRQVSAALDYAHRQGVIHRDIKPSNVMIDTDGNAFLMDFGIARLTEASEGITQTGFAVGTPSYMSPEQGMGLPTVDSRSDIYALGVLLFQMLTGELPFTGDNPMAIILQHMNTPVPAATALNVGLPPAIDTVIQRALAKKPEDRHQTATEMAVDLARAAALGIDAPPTQIKQSAQLAVQSILASRDARKAELDATMASFEALRISGLAARSAKGKDLEGATIVTGSLEEPVKRGRSFPVSAIVLVIALLTLISVLLLLAVQGNGLNPETPESVITSTSPGMGAILPTDTLTRRSTTSPPPSLTPTPTSSASQTPTVQPTQTPSNAPSSTPSTTPTPMATASYTLAPTATPTTPIAVVRRAITVRSGPGQGFPAVQTIDANIALEITGISDDGSWFQVVLPDGQEAWLSASVALVEVAGDVASVPVAWAPTETPTLTLTPSETPSATPSPTIQPTLTPTRTPTPSATYTSSPTATVTPVPAVSYTPSPTVLQETLPAGSPVQTPLPSGTLPFVADFQGPDALSGWDYSPQAWQIVDDAGERILVGQGTLQQPVVILGLEAPEWQQPSPAGLVISARLNLDAQAAGMRILFRFSPQGYYALEVFPGLMVLRRSATVPDPFVRDSEQILRQLGAPISANQWHTVTIWSEGSRIFVYLDRQLYINAEDLTQPQLGTGAILLQTNSQTRPVRFDDISVRRAELASNHFQGPTVPTTWQSSDLANVDVAQEGGGNQYLTLRGEATLSPSIPPIHDISMVCRFYSFEGGYQIRLRVNAGGSMVFSFTGGNLVISQLDALGGVIRSDTVPNIYNRGRWENWQFDFVGSRLQVYRDSLLRYESIFDPSPGAGIIEFVAEVGDVLGIDDCLFTETATSSNIDARAFLAIRAAIAQRPFRLLRSDFDENFDDLLRTDDWWVDGQNAAGQFSSDLAAAEHRQFLRLNDLGRSTWRLIRDVIGFSLFGEGTDVRNFTDSTDLQVSVVVRFPEGGAGTAWLAARTRPTITGANLDGYRLEVRRNADGTITILVRSILPTGLQIVYEGPLPGTENGQPAPGWIPLEIITYRDSIGFFANDTFITSISPTTLLGGTVAIGVEQGTAADFDTFVIRDATPHGE